MNINFGVSSYSRYSPGVWEERVFEVHEKGHLPNIPKGVELKYIDIIPFQSEITNYLDARNNQGVLYPAVRFELKEDNPHSTYKMYLIWIAERGEWVAFLHREWTEGDHRTDESEEGPFALDVHCARMLLEAYGSTADLLPLSEVIKMSPQDLTDHHRFANFTRL